MGIINSIMNSNSFKTLGGGMIGCVLAIIFKILFDYQGTYIISIMIMVLGVCLFTGISIFDYLRKGVDKGKEIIHKEKGKVKVLVSMFGRETPVELEFSQVQKI